MAKFKIDKLMSEYIDGIADKLPLMRYQHVEKVMMKGEELLLTPLGEQMHAEAGKEYPVLVPKYTIVGHRKHLRKAYMRAGVAGLRGYCDRIINAAKSPQNN